MRLRYDGVIAVTFLIENVGTLEPGDEFTVSDEVAPAFLSRGDISKVKVTKTRRQAPVADVVEDVVEPQPEETPEVTTETTAAEEPAAETEPTL